MDHLLAGAWPSGAAMSEAANVRNDRTVDLLARLEAAGEGSRELDAGLLMEECNHDKGLFNQYCHSSGIPHYTTSLDAALTLVPEGHAWCIESEDDGLVSNIRPCATVRPKSGNGKSGPDEEIMYFGATPALALCIAALRARAG